MLAYPLRRDEVAVAAAEEDEKRRLLEDAYQRYREELRRFFAQHSRDPDGVDDLIQTLYLALKRTRPASDLHDPRLYLFGIAWHLIHNEGRRLRAERTQAIGCRLEEFDLHADRSNRLWVEDDTSAAHERAELERVLGELPAHCRLAVIRQYRDNRTYAQIAQELRVSTHAVKKYIMRALSHIRLHYRDAGLETPRRAKRQ
jgi:RNA polymerase sigma-70 factor (ECF subfamily)